MLAVLPEICSYIMGRMFVRALQGERKHNQMLNQGGDNELQQHTKSTN